MRQVWSSGEPGRSPQTGVRSHLGLRVGEEYPVSVGLGQAGWRWWHWQVKAGQSWCGRGDGEVAVAPNTGARCREAGGFWDSSDAWASGLEFRARDGGGSSTGKPSPALPWTAAWDRALRLGMVLWGRLLPPQVGILGTAGTSLASPRGTLALRTLRRTGLDSSWYGTRTPRVSEPWGTGRE